MVALDEAGAEAALLAAIEALYAAPFTVAGWQSALDAVARVLPSVGLAFHGHDELAGRALGVVQAGFDPAGMASFLAHYSSINAWAPAFMRSPAGVLLQSDRLLAREDLMRTEYYHDWLRPQGNRVLGWGSLLIRDSTRYLVFTATLRARDEDDLSEPVRRMMERLIPHVDRAFRVSRLVTGTQIGPGIEAVMESIGHAAYALDAEGRVRHANRRADGFAPQLVRQHWDGRLNFIDPAMQQALDAGLAAMADGANRPLSRALSTIGPRGERIAGLLTPYGTPAGDERTVPWFLAGGPVAILVLKDEGYDVAAVLRRDYGLSAAEVAVATALADGHSPIEIAEVRQTSVLTVRNQVRRVFEKLDVRRQGELAALLAAMAGPALA